jgi:regulation of enolase protein 1 (concanavalin A-like superfamily)
MILCRLAFVPLLMLPLAAFAAPVPTKKSPDEITKLFGTPVDPDKDCTFTVADGKLTITAPATFHALTTPAPTKNAPRVLREVAGDFIATVRVQADLPAAVTLVSDLPEVNPGVAAGLVVWIDEENYVGLIRLHEMLGNRRLSTNEMHWQLGEEDAGASSPPLPLDTAPAYLRLTRSGGRLVGEASPDGETWKRVAAVDFPTMDRVKVGVFMEHTTGQQASAVFDQYELKPTAK